MITCVIHIVILYKLDHILYCFTNKQNPHLYMNKPNAATVSAYYPWAMCLLLWNFTLSKFEILYKRYATIWQGLTNLI